MKVHHILLIFAFFMGTVFLSYKYKESEFAEIEKFKPVIEASYKDGVFTQKKELVDDSLRYKINLNGNKIIFHYTMAAGKEDYFKEYIHEAVKTDSGFVWKCTTGVFFKTSC